MSEIAQPVDADVRQPFRLVVDVLATEEQVQKLQAVIGEIICAAPEEHAGSCRIAWTMGYAGGEDFDGSYGLDDREADFIREQLAPVAVWPRDDVDRSFGL